MNKLKEFLLWCLCFFAMDMFMELIKNLTDNSMLSDWFFVLFCFGVFILGWVGVFFGAKLLQNKTKQDKNLVIGFIYFILIWSVFMVFDVVGYSLEHGLLSRWYLDTIILVGMFIGFAGGHLDKLLSKSKSKKK